MTENSAENKDKTNFSWSAATFCQNRGCCNFGWQRTN